MEYLSFSSDTEQSNTSEIEQNSNLTDLYTFFAAFFDPHLGI